MKLKFILLTLCLLIVSACSNEVTSFSQAENYRGMNEFRNNELSELSRPFSSPIGHDQGAAPTERLENEQSEQPVEQKNVITSFAFQSVKWNDQLYKLTDEKLSEADIELDEAIGEIKHYSTLEAENIPNDYSNFLPEGTKLWAIKGIDSSEAIAVKHNNDSYMKFVKAS